MLLLFWALCSLSSLASCYAKVPAPVLPNLTAEAAAALVNNSWSTWMDVQHPGSDDMSHITRLVLDVRRLLSSHSRVRSDELRDPVVLAVARRALALDTLRKPPQEEMIRTIQEIRDLLDKWSPLVQDNLVTGMPLTRRLVLAVLIRKQAELGVDMAHATLHKAVIDLAIKLFQIHTAAARLKRIIEFFHISKAGGTSLCRLAGRNKCKTHDFGLRDNCMIHQFDDGPRWVSQKTHETYSKTLVGRPWFVRYEQQRDGLACAKRREVMMKSGWNFFANEYAVHGGNTVEGGGRLCPEFWNILLFRDPQDRLISHIKWIIKLYKEHYKRNAAKFFTHNTARFWEKLAPAAMNNYYIRSMLGERSYHRPPNSIYQEDLETARALILQFDILLIMENTLGNELVFNTGMGWGQTLENVHARAKGAAGTDIIKDKELPKDMKVLLEHNSLDVSLYNFTKVVQKLDAFYFDLVRQAAQQGLTALPPPDLSCGYISAPKGYQLL